MSSVATLLQWHGARAVEMELSAYLTGRFAAVHAPHSVSLMLFFKKKLKINISADLSMGTVRNFTPLSAAQC